VLRNVEHSARIVPARSVSHDATAPGKLATAGTPAAGESDSFASSVVLEKDEVFQACEWLAAASRMLLEGGNHDEALHLGLLFEHLEDRLTIAWETSAWETSAWETSSCAPPTCDSPSASPRRTTPSRPVPAWPGRTRARAN
jgi:hypothetical protein